MNTEIVDLYQFYARKAPERGGGSLTGYIPESIFAGQMRPAVLILPGGGYNHVSPREAEPVALRFATAGYAAFVLRYSVAPQVWPTALQEAFMAMAYIRRNAASWGIDPHAVAAVGFSAGGHLCGCLGTLYDGEIAMRIGTPTQLRPDALGLCYPVTVSHGRTHDGSFASLTGGDPALRERLSLEKLVRSDMPPVFLWHTRQDADVPCRGSLLLAGALEEAGVPFAMHIYHKGPHGLSVADETAYPAGAFPPVSGDVPGWPEKMQAFFREFGFEIRKEEGTR